MNFKEANEYLKSLGYERSVKKFGLENTLALLKACGNPERDYLKVQIVGTNGKGSTCAFLEAICLKAGLKVGVTTSPHLVSITERIRINGEDLSDDDFAKYVTIVRNRAESLVERGKLESLPTFFEHLIVIALLAFSDAGIEIAIIEAGLGGRFDSTTATRAEIIGVTSIGLDHVSTLGDTLSLIATEKAAAFHDSADVIIGNQKEEALGALIARCKELNIGPRSAAKLVRTQTFKKKVNFITANNAYELVSLSLKGRHQIDNAANAILLAEAIRDAQFVISSKAIIEGLESAVHRGRLELSDGILFDGAHNVDGALALRDYLKEINNKPIIMVFGAMEGKDISHISSILFPLAARLILTSPNIPRALPAKSIAKFASKIQNALITKGSKEAIDEARRLQTEIEDSLIVVTGSLYLIGEIKAALISEI